MEQTGYLEPLKHVPEDPVAYFLQLGERSISLNEHLGETIRLTYLHGMACVHCGPKIKKTYNNGYCYPLTSYMFSY